MKALSVDNLMKLVGEVTGWGTTPSVKVTYSPRTKYDAYGDRDGVDTKDWGFVVSANICDWNIYVNAQGKTLEEALYKLAVEAINKRREHSKRVVLDLHNASEALVKFRADDLDA